MQKELKNSRYQHKKNMMGLLFVVPSLIGLIAFFIYPLVNSFILSLSTVSLDATKGIVSTFKGFSNYTKILTEDPDFIPELTQSLISMVTNTPITVLFSFFAATLINQKFKGKTIATVIFFLPIITASASILTIDTWDVLQSGMQSGSFKVSDTGAVVSNFQIADFIRQYSGLPETFIATLAGYVSRIYSIIRMSGIQILIIFAGLQSVSPSVYEAADVEGASGWEKFWLITFPMSSSVILLAVVYTVIDSFTGYNNSVVNLIKNTMFLNQQFASGAAMAFIYFAVVSTFVALIILIGNRMVFYYDEK